MTAFVRCGWCNNYSSCSRCPPELRNSTHGYPNEGCRECANRYERTLKDLTEREREVKQQQAEIKFLKLNNADRDPSNILNFGGDLEIEVEGCVLKAHRLILAFNKSRELTADSKFQLDADKSIVFRKMFEIHMVEKETGVVRIHDTTLPVMRAVIDFCYTAEISFTDEATPEVVLQTAHKYVIDHLRDVCGATLVPKINDKNLAEMLRLSSVCEAKELREAASQYLKANFDSVFPSVLKEVFSCLTFDS